MRSAFAISDRFVLTAWHSIRDIVKGEAGLWFRLRRETRGGSREYIYIPVRVTNYDVSFDVAVLVIDMERVPEASHNLSAMKAFLNEVAIPLGVDVRINDEALVIGFPESSSSADSDSNAAQVVDVDVPLGDVSGLKLYGAAFAAVSPVYPHGLSGGPVLRTSRVSGEQAYPAVGVIRAAPRGLIPGTAAGGGLIATRIRDVVDQLPEVGLAVSGARQPGVSAALLELTREGNVAETFTACGRELRRTLVEVDDPDLGKLAGWAHFFDEQREHLLPTAIGTAYGLKLSAVLGEQCLGLDRSALVETLWKLRLRDGGWAARTGKGIARPEVNALVLGALALGGYRTSELDSAARSLGESWSQGVDQVAMERTYVVSAVARGLMRVRPGSPSQLEELRTALVAGVIKDPAHENLSCWSSLLSGGGRRSAPSAPHTAMAIVTLIRIGQRLGEEAQARRTVDEAVRWLAAHRSLDNWTEQIRRFVEDKQPWDTLTVRHFTAAWVARALLLATLPDLPEADTLLIEAVHRVWRDYREGYWEWGDNRERPLWMAYQGACVLKEFALRTSARL